MIQQLKEALNKKYTVKARSEAWALTAGMVEKHSSAMVEQWIKEIDALPTFAGLFSAVLTAFNVQTYQLLRPGPTDTTPVLIHISGQLVSYAVNPLYVNSTQPSYDAIAASTSPFRAPTYAIWLNICWFTSLVLSLASASIGITVKQWLNHYEVDLSGTARETAAIRQHRLNNLMKWKVPQIVAMLPILLQTALVLFFAGLVILLWSIHAALATVVSTLIALLLAFTFCTIILPTFQSDCCYLSPPS
ncbi:hypothetical protein DICSQDRAFT_63130, partial [Dichomitus squalens LYAD-421 SS1]